MGLELLTSWHGSDFKGHRLEAKMDDPLIYANLANGASFISQPWLQSLLTDRSEVICIRSRRALVAAEHQCITRRGLCDEHKSNRRCFMQGGKQYFE